MLAFRASACQQCFLCVIVWCLLTKRYSWLFVSLLCYCFIHISLAWRICSFKMVRYFLSFKIYKYLPLYLVNIVSGPLNLASHAVVHCQTDEFAFIIFFFNFSHHDDFTVVAMDVGYEGPHEPQGHESSFGKNLRDHFRFFSWLLGKSLSFPWWSLLTACARNRSISSCCSSVPMWLMIRLWSAVVFRNLLKALVYFGKVDLVETTWYAG